MADQGFLNIMQAAGLYNPQEDTPRPDLSGLPTAPVGDPDAARYAQKALDYETDAVAASVEGTRNDTLNRAAYKLGSLVSAGHLDGQRVIDSLSAAARVSGLPPSEINSVVWRATRDGGSTPREVHLDPARNGAPAAHVIDLPTSTRATGANDSSDDDVASEVAQIAGQYPTLDWPTVWDQTPDDVEWIAYPFFERGKLYSLYSPAKAGKSLFALDVCAALATGRRVLGNPAGDPLTVLYVDLENSPADLVERLQDLDYQPGQLDRLRYMSFPNLPALDSPAGGRDLTACVIHHQADVVVIDTVSRTIAGGENDSDTFHQLYRHAMVPLKKQGTTIIRLDHAGKDEEKGMRGSSAKLSDVDTAWKLSRSGDGRLRLDRTAARSSRSPESAVVEQRQAPLRHVLVDSSTDDEVSKLAATMDRLDIPQEWGREKARKALADSGLKARNAVLAEAIRMRRITLGGAA